MSFDLEKLVRPNIINLKPYSSARHEFEGDASVYLDANENPFGSTLSHNYNRYPDPYQWQLKFSLTKIKGVPAENIFIGNGSDEVIDLAYRIFCEPGIDNVIICPPTYGMYQVCADINNVQTLKIPLTKEFELDVEGIVDAVTPKTKLIFICSPNNPTGNNMSRENVEIILNNFDGLVIIDEAYINFSNQRSFIRELTEYPNLIVMQTLSKAWGLAALRLGLCYASMAIIDLYNRVKPPYNINLSSQLLGIDALKENEKINSWIRLIVSERNRLQEFLAALPFVERVFPSQANFILVKVNDADAVYHFLVSKGIVIRNRSREVNCEGCLRITVGTPDENNLLIQSFNQYATTA